MRLCPLIASLLFVLGARAEAAPALSWTLIRPGYSTARYDIPNTTSVVRSQIVLAKFDPKLYRFAAVYAPDYGSARDNVRSLAESVRGVAAINANFFDTSGRALGTVISGGTKKSTFHRGGNVLTGVFFQRGDQLKIVHRDGFQEADAVLALQAGPRLIADGKPITVETPNVSSRRSGVALTKKGEVILFATVLRFPGATFSELQTMLLEPGLEITDALNFDGGGSSQLYLKGADAGGEDFLVSGGDIVPVALAAIPKERK